MTALVHFTVRTNDVPALFQGALRAGARPMGAPVTITTAGDAPMTFQAAFVYGPNDEVIEFIDRPSAAVSSDE
ncbi:hypothetical protein [Streptomyces sp. NPDC058964]|uniref:hypothetical protein n=1 Tax=Streptomyces sp. NPDC058964 TaxID=3346681 RepID=UPI0036C199F3